MKYGLMQKIMWSGYRGTFRKHLTETLREDDPETVAKAAHIRAREIFSDGTAAGKTTGSLKTTPPMRESIRRRGQQIW